MGAVWPRPFRAPLRRVQSAQRQPVVSVMLPLSLLSPLYVLQFVKPRSSAPRVYFGKLTYNATDLSFGGFARVIGEYKVGKAVIHAVDAVLLPPMPTK